MLTYDVDSTYDSSAQSDSSQSHVHYSQALAALLKAAGDDLRLQILHVLSRDSFGVLELCTVFAIKQSALSHHLKVLAKAGLVTTRREGNSIFYRRAHQIEPQSLLDLQQSILASSDLLTLSPEIQQGINAVQQERSENSQRFFADNADKFDAQQDLIASLEQYGPAVEEILNGLSDKNAALEIGPGAGEFLQVLSQHFQQVCAIDNSQQMLDKCQLQLNKQSLANVSLKLGDTRSAASDGQHYSCIVANMVLHHTPAPNQIFLDLAQCLQSQGSLIICDLLNHDQSWARENCGDVWLGFEEQELSLWAKAAGLKSGQETYLTLRNGFRIQVRQFLKP